jgi:NADH-quinone oxidoreductase subunit A
MLSEYIGIILMGGLGIFAAFLILFLSHLLGPKRVEPVKLSPYECGVITIGPTHETIPVKYYIVAMLFLVFDLEVVYLYPWATVFKDLGGVAFIEMLVFVFILLIGLFYVWKKGALEWE